jgi:starch phosphorylase
VRERCVFTTHTPIEAGHDKFPYPLVERLLGKYVELGEIKRRAGDDYLNMTRLALNLSGYVNGVSRRHAQTTSKLFPGYEVRAITNGVHAPTWTHASFAALFQANFPQWAHEPEVLERADQLPDAKVWEAHNNAKRELLGLVKAKTGAELDADQPVIGFARRMTEYKRPSLLFSDIERLTAIADKRPFQVVFAGMAHPRDENGRALIEEINQYSRQLSNTIPVVFLPNYDMTVASHLVSGADIWLNTWRAEFERAGRLVDGSAR